MVEFDEFGPEKILKVYDPKTGMRGFTVIDNTALGPGKGGIRMTPTVTLEEVASLARTMTWKCALAELPFGGGKSGIVADDRKVSRKQKFALVRAFSRAIKPVCPREYIAAPDMNMAEQEMRAFALENGSMRSTTGKPARMCVKPGEKCGIPHEYGSTGFGVYHSMLVAINHLGLDPKGMAVAIEGFGNVGSFTAGFMRRGGLKLVAASDSRGCIYNPKGLDFRKLARVKRERGSVVNYRPGKVLDSRKLFTLPVDVIVPSAIPNSINESNWRGVKAKIVVEAANIPATPEIEEKLHRKGVLVVPDFVANAGGVISSYAEYRGVNPKDMFGMVERKIKRNTKLVLDRARKMRVKPRDAALKIAKERVLRAMKRKKRT